MMKRPPPPKVPPSKAPLPLKKTIAVKPKAEAVKGEISSVSNVFAAFLRLCKQRLLAVLAVLLLSSAVGLGLLAALGLGGLFAIGMNMQQLQQLIVVGSIQEIFANPLLLGGGAVMLLLVFLLWSWSYTAMLAAAVDDHHGIIESLCIGWKYLFPMLWVSTLFFGISFCWIGIVSALLPAGMAAVTSMLPSVMPSFDVQNLNMITGSFLMIASGILFGIIFLVVMSWVPFSMIFGFIVMVEEGISNIDALLISRLYVRGHWWNTFFKMLLIWLGLLLLTLLPLFDPFPGDQIAVNFVSLLSTPLLLLYMVAVYRDLKQAAGRVDPDSSCRCLWRMMAAAGILLPLLGVLGAAVAVGPKLPGKLQEIQENLLKGMRPADEIIQPPQTPVSPSSGNEKKDQPPPAPDVRILPSVDGFIIWRDPVGDTRNPLLDIREVSAEGKQGELLLTVTLAKPFAEYFTAKDRESFAQLVSFYFDIDKNESTGAALADGAGRKGYDFELDILLAAAPSGQGQAYPSIYALGPQRRQLLAPLDDRTAVIADSMLSIRLPYDRLDAAVNGKLRMCFREAAQQDGGLAKDQTVPLK